MPPDTPPSRRRRLLRARSVWLLLAVLLLGGGAFAWRQLYARPDANEQYLFATVQRGDFQDLVTATGTVQPRDYVDVGAQVSGQLKKLHVEVGSVVEAGQLLAEIDPTVLKATVDARRAGLRNQRATLAERQAQRALAELQLERQRGLKAEDATTADALQQAEAALSVAAAQVDAIRASIEQTESTLRADEANLNYARIYAPMAGTVVSVSARQGQTLNANQSAPTLLRIADLATMTVQTQVSEADVGKLRTEMPVYFTTLGSQGRRWQGRLRKIEPTPTVTNNVVLYNALFDVPNPNQALMSNMTAQVFFIAASARDTLLLPAAAVNGGAAGGPGERGGRRQRSGADGATSAPAAPSARASAPGEREARGERTRGPRRASVKLLRPDGQIEERPVELGLGNRVQVQVLAGLKEGEQVVVGRQPAEGERRGNSANASALAAPGGMPPGLGGGAPRGR